MYKLFLLSSGALSALASILLRVAGRSHENFSQLTLALFDRPMLLRVGALGAYAAGFVCYSIALKKLELSVAYPLMVGVTIALVLVFGMLNSEVITVRTLIGAALLITAMVLLYAPKVTAA
jgi:small multidrug resistance pump